MKCWSRFHMDWPERTQLDKNRIVKWGQSYVSLEYQVRAPGHYFVDCFKRETLNKYFWAQDRIKWSFRRLKDLLEARRRRVSRLSPTTHNLNAWAAELNCLRRVTVATMAELKQRVRTRGLDGPWAGRTWSANNSLRLAAAPSGPTTAAFKLRSPSSREARLWLSMAMWLTSSHFWPVQDLSTRQPLPRSFPLAQTFLDLHWSLRLSLSDPASSFSFTGGRSASGTAELSLINPPSSPFTSHRCPTTRSNYWEWGGNLQKYEKLHIIQVKIKLVDCIV